MNDTSKLLLTVVIGGIMLGAGLSRHISTTMIAGPDDDWRDRYRSSYSDTSMRFIDAGPVDLNPSLPWPGGASQDAAVLSGNYAPDLAADHVEADFAEPYAEAGENVADTADARPMPTVEEAGDRAAAIAGHLRTSDNPIPAPDRLAPPADRSDAL